MGPAVSKPQSVPILDRNMAQKENKLALSENTNLFLDFLRGPSPYVTVDVPLQCKSFPNIV